MKRLILAAVCIFSGALTAHAQPLAQPLPADIKAALDAAKTTGNSYVMDATVAGMKTRFPAYAKAVESYVAAPVKAESATVTPAKVAPTEAAASTSIVKEYVPFLRDWKGSVKAGANWANGNTQRQQYNAGLTMDRDWQDWAVKLDVSAKGTRENKVRTEERYRLNTQLDRKLDAQNYVFGGVEYVNDVFSGFNYRTTETLGYGRHLLQRPKLKLNTQVGLGVRESEDSVTEKKTTEVVATPKADLLWKVTDNLDFSQDLYATIGSKKTISHSTTALKSKLIGNLSMQLQLDVEHVSTVPTGTKKTDSTTSLNLVYDF